MSQQCLRNSRIPWASGHQRQEANGFLNMFKRVQEELLHYRGGLRLATESEVMESLSNVEDPELNLKVTDLGLIYSVDISSSHVEVEMTLTSPGCPVAPELMAAVHRAALATEGIESVQVNLTFSPPWDLEPTLPRTQKFEMGFSTKPVASLRP